MQVILTVSMLIVLASLPPVLRGQETSEIPMDTTYNLRSATQKIQKRYPYALPVEDRGDCSRPEKSSVVYRSFPNRELHMDIFQPVTPSAEKSPCILCIHGGGWASGNKSLLEPLAMELARNGYVTATVEYRLSPEARYPAGVTDVKQAIKWLKRNAGFLGIDTSRLAILGTSAGATIATLVGNTPRHPLFRANGEEHSVESDQVQVIINIDGILDFTDPAESGKDTDPAKPSAAARWLGFTYKENPGLWKEASPLAYAGTHSPPTLFINSSIPRFHAGRDAYTRILKELGIETRVVTLPDSPHSFWLFHPWFDPTVEEVLHFLNDILWVQ